MTRPGGGASTTPASGSAAPSANTGTGSSNSGFQAFADNPDYYQNQPYYMDKVSGGYVKLEKGTPEMKVSTVAAPFYASSKSSWMMEGDRSSVQISASVGISFVMKLAPGIDPDDIVRLVKFDLVKRGRRDPQMDRHMPATAYSGGAYGGGSTSVSNNDVKCTYQRVADGVMKVTPESGGLSSGEYGFYIMHKFYCFSIN